METVRKGCSSDFSKVRELWAECFGADEFAEWFFARLYAEQFLRVCEVDGEVVSMAFCFPKTLVVSGREYRAWYLYGIGTKRETRGRGYAKRLISACVAEAKSLGIDLCFLIPAEQSLFSFYNACGFDLVWTRSEEIHVTDSAVGTIAVETVTDVSQVNAIYEHTNSGYLKRDLREWELLKEEFRMADGDLYFVRRDETLLGYCFAVKEKSVLTIRELGLLQSDDCALVCHALANTLHATSWKYTYPGNGMPFAVVFPFAEELRSCKFINCDLLHN